MRLLGALQLAELGAMIPRSGGQYVFARYALGEYPGFIVGWSDWISTCGTTAAVALVVGEFAVALFPALGRTRHGDRGGGRRSSSRPLQWRGIRWGSGDPERHEPAEGAGLRRAGAAAFAIGGEARRTRRRRCTPPAGFSARWPRSSSRCSR